MGCIGDDVLFVVVVRPWSIENFQTKQYNSHCALLEATIVISKPVNCPLSILAVSVLLVL